MTEEQIREIVRDEIEAECLKQGGVYDHVRQVSFNVVQGVTQMIAGHMQSMWDGHSNQGPN
jgi:hypothetical protein